MSDISVGSVAVDVVPDTRIFASELRAKLSDLSTNIRLDPEMSGFEEKVDTERKRQEKQPAKVPVKPQMDDFASKIRAQATAIGKSASVDLPITAEGEKLRRDVAAQVALINELVKVEIPLDLEGATAVRAKMAVELDVLKAMAASADPTVNVDADTGAAQAKIAALGAESRVAGSGISGMAAGIVALGPALVPITAAVVGLGAALGAPLAAAGGGATIFGLIAGKEISNTNKVAKQIAELKAKANTLVDPKAAANAAAQAKNLEDSLTGPQKAFIQAKDTLSKAFGALTKTAGGAVFRPIIQAMKLLGDVMPQLAPVIKSVSSALSGMLREIGDSAKSGGIKDFLAFLGQMSGPVLTSFAVVLGNVATGFAGLFRAFAPVAGGMTAGLLKMSGAFADFGRNAGSNKGLQSFIGYVQQVGPQVLATLGSLVKALVHIGVALAPFGGIVLGSIKFLADAISAIPTPILTVLAGMIGTVVIGLKLWAIAQGILNVVMDANPIGLVILAIAGLVAGLVLAYKNSETFRRIVDAAFRGVADAASFMWNNVIKPIFRFWLNTWFALIGAMVNGAAKAFGWVPGIGGKLKAAAAEFNAFRDRVNAALDGIHSTKEIHLNVTTTQSVKLSSINKPRVPMGATGAIVNRPTMAIIGEAGPEAVVPLNRTAGNAPLPTGSGVDAEQSYYRAFSRALANSGVVIMSKSNLDDLDLLVGSA